MQVRHVVLWCIVVLAFALRLVGLGGPSFDTDEYFHVVAAQALLDGHGAVLPSGFLYDRAIEWTALVATSFAAFGVSEASARWPAMGCGVATIALVAVVGRRWFGPRVGLLAAALTAVHPDLVAVSRTCRMYALSVLLFLGALFLIERAFARPTWRTVGSAGAVVVLALRLHPFAYELLAVAALVLACVSLRAASSSTRSVVLIVLLGMLAAAWFAEPVHAWAADAWVSFRTAPPWAAHTADYERYYFDRWSRWLPGLLCWLSLGALVIAHRARRPACLLLLTLAMALTIHSTMGLKAPRYAAHVLPLLAIVVAAGVDGLGGLVARGVTLCARPRRTSSHDSSDRMTVCRQAIVILAGGLLLHTPLKASWARSDERHRPDWSPAFATVRAEMRPTDALLTTLPLAASHYLRRPSTGALSHPPGAHAVRNENGRFQDWSSGNPLITSAQDLSTVLARRRTGWIVVAHVQLTRAGALPLDLQRALRSWPEHEVLSRSGDVVLLHWERRRRGSAWADTERAAERRSEAHGGRAVSRSR